jgi:hypothetical protein
LFFLFKRSQFERLKAGKLENILMRCTNDLQTEEKESECYFRCGPLYHMEKKPGHVSSRERERSYHYDYSTYTHAPVILFSPLKLPVDGQG